MPDKTLAERIVALNDFAAARNWSAVPSNFPEHGVEVMEDFVSLLKAGGSAAQPSNPSAPNN